MEIVTEVSYKYSDFYTRNGELQKGKRVVSEMETIDEDYCTACETAREYLESRIDDRSSVTSNIMSIDMLLRMNISDDTET